jgi:uncharacterized protein (DUF885 family)
LRRTVPSPRLLTRSPRADRQRETCARRYATTSRTAEQIAARVSTKSRASNPRWTACLKDRIKKLEEDNWYPDSLDVCARVLAGYEKIIRNAYERSAEAFDRRPKSGVHRPTHPQVSRADACRQLPAPAGRWLASRYFPVPLGGPRFSKVQMRTLAHHEAVSGRHFQIALQVEMTSPSPTRRVGFVRRRLGR